MADQASRLLMLVDDEPAQCRLVSAIASRAGWRTIIARDAETAIAMLGTQEGMMLDAILLDQWVPGGDAPSLIAELKSRRPALPILLLTSIGSSDAAIQAMRAGATDYLLKPVPSERLVAALALAADRAKDFGELQPLTEKIAQPLAFEEIIGSSTAFRAHWPLRQRPHAAVCRCCWTEKTALAKRCLPMQYRRPVRARNCPI